MKSSLSHGLADSSIENKPIARHWVNIGVQNSNFEGGLT